MNPQLLRLLALLGQGGMVAGGLGMLVDESNKEKPKYHESYEDYLKDEDIPLEERMKRVEQIQSDRYKNSQAHKAKLEALKKLQGE